MTRLYFLPSSTISFLVSPACESQQGSMFKWKETGGRRGGAMGWERDEKGEEEEKEEKGGESEN